MGCVALPTQRVTKWRAHCMSPTSGTVRCRWQTTDVKLSLPCCLRAGVSFAFWRISPWPRCERLLNQGEDTSRYYRRRDVSTEMGQHKEVWLSCRQLTGLLPRGHLPIMHCASTSPKSFSFKLQVNTLRQNGRQTFGSNPSFHIPCFLIKASFCRYSKSFDLSISLVNWLCKTLVIKTRTE